MNCYIVHAKRPEPQILSVHQTLMAAMLYIWSYAAGGIMPDGSMITAEGIENALNVQPSIEIRYQDDSVLSLERHILGF